MEVALWIVGGVTVLVFVVTGGALLFMPQRWLVARGATWARRVPTWLVKVTGGLELLGAAVICLGLFSREQYAPASWWLIAAASCALVFIMIGSIVVRAVNRERWARPAVNIVLAAATGTLALLLASAWPGGVTAPTVPVPHNSMWTASTKPDPVPHENVVLSLPEDMYRHKDAPTEWWWLIGTLRAGDRVFGFEINAASFYGQGFAMTQVMLADIEAETHYERTQVYVPKPLGVFDVSTWAEGDPAKDWYAKLGDADWMVGGFTVTEAGSGYTEAPTVEIVGDGSGASAMAVLNDDGSLGQIVLLDPGSGYTSTPEVRVTGGGGSGAQAVAVRNYVSIRAPQADPSQNIEVQALLVDDSTLTEVEFDLEFSQQGRPFYVFGTGIEPSATKQSLTEDNYYFSFTRLAASGTITIDGEVFEVEGTTWMDHEYGWFGDGSSEGRVRWLLQDLQLDNGFTISNAGIIGEGYKPEIGVAVDSYATVQDDDGELYYVSSRVTPIGELWTSPRTGNSYAQQFLVEIPSFDASFIVTSRMQDQEFDVWGAPIYEGTAEVEGEILGEIVRGDSWIEQAF